MASHDINHHYTGRIGIGTTVKSIGIETIVSTVPLF